MARYSPVSRAEDGDGVPLEDMHRDTSFDDERTFDDLIAELDPFIASSDSDSREKKAAFGIEGDDDAFSPANMVKKVVPETDDPSMPCLTFRAAILGIIICIIGAAGSQLFYFKSNAPSFSSFFIVLISYPMGKACHAFLPSTGFRFMGKLVQLNPGPFTVKEHIIVVIIASSGANAAYAGDIVAVQDLYYHQDIGPIGGLLLLITTQVMGFGLAGLAYDILVRPTSMIWPATLVVYTMFQTLHGDGAVTRKRLRFFYLAFLGMFAWQFLPGLFTPTLTSIAFLCIINNSSNSMRVLGSGYKGFGLGCFSLDWSVIGGTGGLYTPFWASLNFYGGFASWCWIFLPLVYFGNFWDAKSFPSPVTSMLFNSTYNKFDVNLVVNQADLSLNQTAWNELAPILLTPSFALSYGLFFAILTSTIVTVLCWDWDLIKNAFTKRNKIRDVHIEILERSYPNVPAQWYWTIGLSMLGLAMVLVIVYPLQLPIWGLLLANIVALVFLIPCGIIAATTNTVVGLNVITEFVAGYLLPGQPIANITFKCFGYMSMSQALAILGDLKMGVYCKIPPRSMFVSQCIGTVVGAMVNYVFLKGVIEEKRMFLDGRIEDPTGQWTGRKPSVFYSASVIWGLIGPARFFTGRYAYLFWGFVIGAILPIIPWLAAKRWPKYKSILSKISFPLILHGATVGPTQVPSNVIVVGFLSAILSQWWALRKHPRWFDKYNYVLSSAFDSATSVNALVIYLFGLGALMEGKNWWFNPSDDAEHCLPGS